MNTFEIPLNWKLSKDTVCDRFTTKSPSHNSEPDNVKDDRHMVDERSQNGRADRGGQETENR